MKPVFSTRAISRAMRAGDSHRFDLDVIQQGESLAEALAEDVTNRRVALTGFVQAQARGKPCITYPDYNQTLVLRILAAYIARRFRTTPPNRDRVVSGVIETMMDATPYTVIRRDVSSFYESVNADALRARLIYDTSLPRIVRHFLSQYFDTHCPAGKPGLPRGVGLSGILAELAMEPFDRRVRSLPGVYRYFRYSDDIVIFCYDGSAEVETEIETALPHGMHFHPKKRSTTPFVEKPSAPRRLDYLGYQFLTNTGSGGKIPRTVEVSISPDKIKRLKTRVVLSIKRHLASPEPQLLIDRLRLLTSNYQLQRHGVSFWSRRKRVRSGIYYNYRRCGRYDGRTFTSLVPDSLSGLDNFTHHLLKSPHSEFSARLRSTLLPAHWTHIGRISFRLGFQGRRLLRLSYSRLAQAREAWRNV